MSFTPTPPRADAGSTAPDSDAGPQPCGYSEVHTSIQLTDAWPRHRYFPLCLPRTPTGPCWVTSHTDTRSCPAEHGRAPIADDPTRCEVLEAEAEGSVGFWIGFLEEECGAPPDDPGPAVGITFAPGESFIDVTCLLPVEECR